MVSQEHKDIIEKEAKRFFEKLGLAGDVEIEKAEDAAVSIRVTASDPQIFIGERGETLFDIQHLLKSILRKKIPEQFYLSLDINDYRKNKEEFLKELARDAADEVALLKKTKELPPMPASDRRIIHMALAERGDVTSESIGEEPERRVEVRPKPQKP